MKPIEFARRLTCETTNYLAFPYRGKSMGNIFRQGDVLLVERVAWEKIKRGDIIAFRRNKGNNESVIVAHRVRERMSGGFVTQGDNNRSLDSKLVVPAMLVGRVCCVYRNGNCKAVESRLVGHFCFYKLSLCKCFALIFVQIYRFIKSKRIVNYFWRPQIAKVQLVTKNGLLTKYIHKGQTIAYWWHEQERFNCKHPYDLMLQPPLSE